MNKLIQLADIKFNLSPKTRSEINCEAVIDYQMSYENGEKLPAPILYKTKDGLLIADGLHRLTALKKSGVQAVICEVREGGPADLFKASIQGNLHHGVRRTTADKRESVITAIGVFHEMADMKIAELCAVSHSTVAQVRKELETKGKIKPRETIKTQDGKDRPAKINHPSVAARKATPASPDKAKTVVVDDTGYPVPDKAMPAWNRKLEAEQLVGVLTNLRHGLMKSAKAKDFLFVEVNMSALVLEIDAAEDRLARIVPYAVCPMCQGKLTDKCKCCDGRGVISKFKYETGVPEDVKKARNA
jgi:hypothetical protein